VGHQLARLLAELVSKSLDYSKAELKDRELYQHLDLLEHKISLMLNPAEEDQIELEKLIRAMVATASRGPAQSASPFDIKATAVPVMRLSRQVLKREWDRVKEGIEVKG
jgi:hypothetical protein